MINNSRQNEVSMASLYYRCEKYSEIINKNTIKYVLKLTRIINNISIFLIFSFEISHSTNKTFW